MMQTRKHRFLLFSAIAVIAALLTAVAAAQSGDFIIAQHGKPVGTATMTISPNPHGFSSTSVVRIDMKGLNYNLSKTEQLSPARHLRHVQLSATVNNSAVNVTAAPSPAQSPAQIVLTISANGRTTTTPLAAHASVIFLADFDPGGFDNLLALGAGNGNRGLWAIIPKQAGSIKPIQLATYADEKGTLDGKPISVHHLVATIAGDPTNLFSGPENQLLQAELSQEAFALVRKGFVLTPPAKPGAPPTKTAPSAQPGAPPSR